MRHRAFLPLSPLVAAALVLALAAPAGATKKYRVDLVTPDSLTNLQNGTTQTLFQHDAQIPYATLQAAINGQLSSAVDAEGDKSGNYAVGYVDYDYHLDSSASLAFTDPGQPSLTILSASQNKIRVAVHTEAKLTFHAKGVATTDDHMPVVPPIQFPDFDGTITVEALFKIDAKADVALWPTIAASNVEVKLANDVPTVKVVGLEGDTAGFAISVGTALGFTPGGLLAGGPAAMSLVALIGNHEAHDYVVTLIRDGIAEALQDGVQKANEELKDRIQNQLIPAVASANSMKDQALGMTIPGVGVSVQQAQSQLGASLDVRTISAPAFGIRTIASVRFDGNPRGGRVAGVIRLPKAKCRNVGGSFAGLDVQMGLFDPFNTDLSDGMSCNAVLGSGMGVKGYLGTTPPTTSLPNWKTSGGTLVGIGSAKEVSTGGSSGPGGPSQMGYFECAFEVRGLPKGAVNFASTGALEDRLADYDFVENRWVALSGTGSQWEIGGPGKCESGGVSGGLTLNKAAAKKKELDDCPECGRQSLMDPGSEVMRPLDPGGTLQRRGLDAMNPGAGASAGNPAAQKVAPALQKVAPAGRSVAPALPGASEGEGEMRRSGAGARRGGLTGGAQQQAPQIR